MSTDWAGKDSIHLWFVFSHQVMESLSRLVKALSILEKYGCNLTSPTRPRYWRSVKHNNPVFRTTVDAIKVSGILIKNNWTYSSLFLIHDVFLTCFLPQGGRRVLFLYGYTNQQIDGLSFPDEITEPDCDKVAAVTLEVMALRTEVDMLLKVSVGFWEKNQNQMVASVPDKKPNIRYVSLSSGHPSSPRMLQRHHPGSYPAGLHTVTYICIQEFLCLIIIQLHFSSEGAFQWLCGKPAWRQGRGRKSPRIPSVS